jgi:hypothetical protein
MDHKKFLLLTSITNNKDTLTDPKFVFDNCDYVAITDRKYDVNIWKQEPILRFSTIDEYHHRRNAKIYKILNNILFPNYEYIIWIDGTHELKVNPQDILNEYGEADLYCFNHPVRNCVLKEIKAVINLDDIKKLEQQYKFYIQNKMPKNYGLMELSSFMIHNNPKIKILSLAWWEQICKFSSRDQCSLPYCLWQMEKNNLKVDIKFLKGYANTLDGNIYFDKKEKHNH